MRHPYFTHFRLRDPVPSMLTDVHDVEMCTSQWEAGLSSNLRQLQQLEAQIGQRWMAIRFEEVWADPGFSPHASP